MRFFHGLKKAHLSFFFDEALEALVALAGVFDPESEREGVARECELGCGQWGVYAFKSIPKV